MEIFSAYWPFVRGIHQSPVDSPHKSQWRRAFMFSLICSWINGWVNNREAGDLRRHRAHYDVIVMKYWFKRHNSPCCLRIQNLYTPLWKSNRNLFSTQIFYHLFFVVCSSFYTWYVRGGQYQISKFLLDFDHWLYFNDILKKVTGSKPDVALVWFMQWAKMELEHGEKHRYCRIVRV